MKRELPVSNQTLRAAVARQIEALAKKLATWETAANDNTKEGVALMKAQLLNAHSALRANDIMALLAIKEEIETDHTNLGDFA